MNITEAAKALGISEKPLRRYIKKGIIEARLLQGKTGQEWQIEMSSLEAFKQKVVPSVRGRIPLGFPNTATHHKRSLPFRTVV